MKIRRENPHSGKIRQKYRALLHEDLSTYYCCRRHNIAIKQCSQPHITATMQRNSTLAFKLTATCRSTILRECTVVAEVVTGTHYSGRTRTSYAFH
jgi:hypothetical protein